MRVEHKGLKEERRIYSVSEITEDIKALLENTFPIVWVEGEVSNYCLSQAGHCYFSLKDANAVLTSVIFKACAKDIKFKVENGLKVICCGHIGVWGPQGRYQLIIEKIEPKGIGSLQLALEQLKDKLQKEGLFDAARKRPIPRLPARIGVVTSLQGAAIKDILKVLDRRFKALHIIINPARVQGEGAGQDIARAIDDFNAYNELVGPDRSINVLIIGRGGGSAEDLWAFNEEIVARAVYNSKIPTISAVGHERDWTIADLVSDLRAATPSVAAELVIPEKEELEGSLVDLQKRLKEALRNEILLSKESLDDLSHRFNLACSNVLKTFFHSFDSAVKKLSLLNPLSMLLRCGEKNQDIYNQLNFRIKQYLALKETKFSGLIEKLSGLSPLNILARGYSITFKHPSGELVKDSRTLREEEVIKTKFGKGEILSRVIEVI